MQRDERATHLAYKTSVDKFIVPLVEAHFGGIVKSTGDGFFAQFDSLVSAMECALDIQANLSDFQKQNTISPALQFRLGVSSGDVISEEEDIYGNDVNLAARLQEQAQPGAICITAGTYEQVRAKLAAQFEDLGAITFKNSGETARVYTCYPKGAVPWAGQSSAQKLLRIANKLFQNGPARIVAASVILTLAISGLINELGKPRENNHQKLVGASPQTIPTRKAIRPSIAVLAFENRSQSSETRALSLGMSETIATALAASQRFLVIDPKSSLEFSSAEPSMQNVAEQLNVRFLLVGSVNQKGQKIRVNVRLVDIETGRNHWAYSVLENVSKVFDIEDKISNDVIAALSEGPRVPSGRGVRGGTRNIAAYKNFLKGWQLLKANPFPNIEMAISNLENAILIDPEFGNAHAALAAAYVFKSHHISRFNSKNKMLPIEEYKMLPIDEYTLSDRWIARQDYLEKANTYLNFALNEPTAYAYRISAQINYIKRDYEAAARDLRNAYIIDPNDADSAAEYGMSLIWSGETQEGVKAVEKAMRINPRGSDIYRSYLGVENFIKRRFRAAIENLETAIEVDPGNEMALIHTVASYGHLNLSQKAQEYIRILDNTREKRGVGPIYIQRILRKIPYKLQSDRLHLATGLHRAGMKYGIRHLAED